MEAQVYVLPVVRHETESYFFWKKIIGNLVQKLFDYNSKRLPLLSAMSYKVITHKTHRKTSDQCSPLLIAV